jgi:protease IV
MKAKRWVALVAALILFLGMVYAVARFGGAGIVRGPGPYDEVLLQGEGLDKIAVIDVEGQIVENGDPTTQAVAEELVAQLRQARLDQFVRAVILRVNSPGGSVVASAEIYNQVLDLKRAGKPVVASFGEVAASGGYYISAGASRIVSDPSTFTGSIGVILILVNLEEAAGNLGIEPIVVKSGRLKDIGSPFRDLTEEERGIFQALIDESYERFVDVVSEGRHLPESEVRELATGQPYSGQQALDAGLVDSLGGFDRAVEVAERLAGIDNASVVEYQPRITLQEILGGGFPGFDSALSEIEDRVGVTGPVLKYLYVT